MRIQSRSGTIGDNRPAENAIIESITMVNFMNHEKCHLELGPLINFIVGENGSGKSAALTALIICLGTKAAATNRGASLKSFIKEGREMCNLSVKIKNQGTDAYKPDVFGQSIIVERHFSKSGAAGFKIKSAAGRIISTKKQDVDEIMEYYQMQVNNPMTVLSQDNAKQFLNSAPPSLKYSMFMKGVQLEQLDTDYRLVAEMADSMQASLQDTEGQLKTLTENERKAKAAVEVVHKNQNMREKEKSLVRQMAWGQVEEEEAQLKERQEIVEATQIRLADAQKVVQQKDEQFQEMNIRLEQAVDSIAELNRNMEPIKEEESTAKEAHDAATQEIMNIHRQHRQIGESLQVAKKEVARLQGEIQAEMTRIENANGGAHAQKIQDLDTAKERVEQARKNLNEKSDDNHLQDLLRNAIADFDRSKQPMQAKHHEIEACQSRLRTMSQDANQHTRAFDSKIWQLKKIIEREGGFRETPIGPVGMYITLLKPIWGNVIERTIGNNLSGFVCTSKPDQQRLQGMMRRLNLHVPILIGNNTPIDLRGHEPDESFDTVLRVLNIESDLILRQLIIGQAIEQSILIQDRQACLDALYKGPKPKNVKQGFSLNDNRRGWGWRFGYVGQQNDQSANPVKPPERTIRMKTDVQSQIAYQKETLRYLQTEYDGLKQKSHDVQRVVQRYENALRDHKRAKQEAGIQLQRAEEAVERIQDDLAKDSVEDGRLEALKVDLTEAEDQVKTDTGSYVQAQVQKDKQNQAAKVLKQALEQVKHKVADHEAVIRKAEGKHRRLIGARQIILQEKNAAIDILENAKTDLVKAETHRDNSATTVAEFVEEATKICAYRIVMPPNKKYKDIESEYHELMKTMKKQRERQGKSDQQILEEYENASKSLEVAKKVRDDSEELLYMLKQSYNKRLDKWREFQSHISAAARMQFTYLLSERGFRGKLTLDHKTRTLTLSVEPDETKKNDKGRNTQTLSGGEKSFSNVCLLMSVWDAMGSPLRCLDEFDVYMDSVNRDVTSKLIIGAARRSVGKQFIIISPLSIGGNVERDADVRIHRLPSSKRKGYGRRNFPLPIHFFRIYERAHRLTFAQDERSETAYYPRCDGQWRSCLIVHILSMAILRRSRGPFDSHPLVLQGSCDEVESPFAFPTWRGCLKHRYPAWKDAPTNRIHLQPLSPLLTTQLTEGMSFPVARECMLVSVYSAVVCV